LANLILSQSSTMTTLTGSASSAARVSEAVSSSRESLARNSSARWT
jgi:hypothetical protein